MHLDDLFVIDESCNGNTKSFRKDADKSKHHFPKWAHTTRVVTTKLL
jgi:hypothetical protein